MSKFLLRHGRQRPDGIRAWTLKHARWLDQQRFELPTLQVVYDEYRATLGLLADRVARLERAIQAALPTLAPTQQALVAALATLRGVKHLTAATIVSEVGTLRRFATARHLMGYTGLVPREHSSGSGVHRGAITKTGNAHLRRVLVEAAWAYRHRANMASGPLRARQAGQPAPVIAIDGVFEMPCLGAEIAPAACAGRVVASGSNMGFFPVVVEGPPIILWVSPLPEQRMQQTESLPELHDREHVEALNDQVREEGRFVEGLRAELAEGVIGQRVMLDRLLIGLLADGHVLIEGVPGLAKTLAVRTLAEAVSCRAQRVQFTPDLLPSDLVGTMVYNQRTGGFTVQKGPIFANIVLADEINRAPAKVQSALLEAMQEKQVTIGGTTYTLDEPFLVLATQNPIEQEGTYPLPEAQVDRFMLKLVVTYPARADESEMLDRMSARRDHAARPVVDTMQLLRAREVVDAIYLDSRAREYALDVVRATRDPTTMGLKDLAPLIAYGASPRAAIALVRAAKAHAFLSGRGYVTPADIKTLGPDVLRHRLILTYEADAESVTADEILARIFDAAPVP